MKAVCHAFKLMAILDSNLGAMIRHMASSYQDDYIKTALRIPRELHAALMESARERGRSFNAELLDRLQASLAPSGHGEAIFQLHAQGEGGPLAPEVAPARREIAELSERLIKLENTMQIIASGIKGGRFGKIGIAESQEPKKE